MSLRRSVRTARTPLDWLDPGLRCCPGFRSPPVHRLQFRLCRRTCQRNGLTGEQRFFLAYAVGWKRICRPETARNLLLTDGHSPEKYRVNGIVRNMDEWYAAFDVKDGDALFLKPEDRIKV